MEAITRNIATSAFSTSLKGRYPALSFIMRHIVFLLLFALSLGAAESEEAARERLRRVGAEVERRRIQREQYEAEQRAAHLVREHESGAKKATEEQLAAARALLRAVAERKAKEPPPTPANGLPREIQLMAPDADISLLARTWRIYFGGNATITERAKAKGGTVIFSASSPEETRRKFEAALREIGIHVLVRPDGVVFDTEPESSPQK